MTSPQTEWGFCQVLVVAIGSVQRDLWLDLCLRHEDHTCSHHFRGEGILQITCKCIEQTQRRTKDRLEWKAETIPFNLSFICFSFVLWNIFERIIKSPLFGSILEVWCRAYQATKILQQVTNAGFPSAGRWFQRPRSFIVARVSIWPATPTTAKKNRGRVGSQVSLEVGSTGRIEQGKCMVFLELFPAENFSDCCIR